MNDSSSRREFLRWSAGFSVMGAAAPIALQLTAVGNAAAATAPDYKAIVCLFLQGGQDSNNMVLATDDDSWGRYTSARNTGAAPIALSRTAPRTPPANGAWGTTPSGWGGVIPIPLANPQPIPAGTATPAGGVRTFGLHPMLHDLVLDPLSAAPNPNSLWAQKRLAVLANVGTLITPTTKAQFNAKSVPIPQALGSHNDQQSAWQSGAIDGAQTGWGGRLADILASQNGDKAVFTSVSADGTAVFLSGDIQGQYQINTDLNNPAIAIRGISGKLFGTSAGSSAFKSIIQDQTGASNFARDYAAVVQRSIGAASVLNAKFKTPGVVAAPPAYREFQQGFNDVNPWTTQLNTVAQMIAAAPGMGIRRQVFFLRLDQHDTHDSQNQREPQNLLRLAQALVYFDQVLGAMPAGKDATGVAQFADMRACVTAFTASDFSRGFATNGSGTDHAWGGHHLIMGGAVRGGDMYGQYPTLGIDKTGFNNPDIVGNNMLPTTSVDQYGATLGRWFGVQESDLHTIFPNLRNYATPFLGFV
jgi:uncharacterized protein (DUF1501 family)